MPRGYFTRTIICLLLLGFLITCMNVDAFKGLSRCAHSLGSDNKGRGKKSLFIAFTLDDILSKEFEADQELWSFWGIHKIFTHMTCIKKTCQKSQQIWISA